MWKFLAVAVLFSFGVSVHGDLSDNFWLNYGSDVQERFLRAIGYYNNDRWQNVRVTNWGDTGEYNKKDKELGDVVNEYIVIKDRNLGDRENYGDDKYDIAKGVSIGYDEGFAGKRSGVLLRVNEDEVRNEDNLVRPCALNDWQCIRKFFAYNSKCTPAYGPSPDPLYLARNTVYLPFVNMTITLTDDKVTGLGSAKITEFYVNKKTGNLVFAIEVQNLNQTVQKAYLNYRRTAKESIVLADYATVEFKSAITFTAVIPKDESGLRLDLADIHADVDDSLPPFFLGPKAYASTDPDVVSAFAALTVNLRTIIREALFFQSQLFTALYIQQNVCNFGLKLYSV